MGGPVSVDRRQALEPARVVARAPVLLLDAGVCGRRSTYLGAVHGFVATALPLIRGRHLLDAEEWMRGSVASSTPCSAPPNVVGAHANWRPQLDSTSDANKKLLQFCHGAPGFVICLAGLPGTALDDLLLAAGETIWSAGPLAKGSNLCHGTGGNGYAFLKLYRRTRGFAVAGARALLRHARHCANTGGCRALRAIALLVVDRRSRFRHLSLGLPARGSTVPDAGRLLRELVRNERTSVIRPRRRARDWRPRPIEQPIEPRKPRRRAFERADIRSRSSRRI